MKTILLKHAASFLGLITLGILSSGISAQAETLPTADAAPIVPVTAESISSKISAPSASQENLTAQTDLESPNANATTPDSATSTVMVADATAPTAEVAQTDTPVNQVPISDVSTSASDLVPETANTEAFPEAPAEESPAVVAQAGPTLVSPPRNNFVGVGVNFGDESGFAILSKISLTQGGAYGISVRPAAIFNDDNVDFRIPLTVEAQLATGDAVTSRLIPFAGAGVAIDTRRDTEVDLMLTAGSDFVINPQFSATAALNLLFLNTTDLEVMLGVGYNF